MICNQQMWKNMGKKKKQTWKNKGWEESDHYRPLQSTWNNNLTSNKAHLLERFSYDWYIRPVWHKDETWPGWLVKKIELNSYHWHKL